KLPHLPFRQVVSIRQEHVPCATRLARAGVVGVFVGLRMNSIIHHLRKKCLAHVHAALQVVKSRKLRKLILRTTGRVARRSGPNDSERPDANRRGYCLSVPARIASNRSTSSRLSFAVLPAAPSLHRCTPTRGRKTVPGFCSA